MRIFGSNAGLSLRDKREKKEKEIKPGVKSYKDYFFFYCIRKLDLADTLKGEGIMEIYMMLKGEREKP